MNTKSAIRLWRVIFISLLTITGATGCSTRPSYVSGGAVGAVTGGGLGAVVCNDISQGQGRTAAMIGCGLAGAAAGSLIGASLDELQVRRAQPGQRPPPPPPHVGAAPPHFYPTPYPSPVLPPPSASLTYPTPYAYPPAPMQHQTPPFPYSSTHSQNADELNSYRAYPLPPSAYPAPPR